MRSKLAQRCRKLFEERLAASLPQFERIKTSKVGPTSRLYGYQVTEGVWFLIMHQISHQDEHFTVELMTNTDPGVPLLGAFRNPREDPYTIPIRFRFSRMWSATKSDPWWELEPAPSGAEITRRLREMDFSETPIEELMPKVEPLVDEAFAKLMEYGVPYFNEVAAKNELNVTRPL